MNPSDFGLSDADDYALLKQPAGTQKYMAPEQQTPGVKIDGRADIYAFGLLLKEIFPHRYRCIASKCTRADRERRYSDVEAVKKAFDRRSLWHRISPFFGGMAMVVLISIFYEPYKVASSAGYSPEFTQLLERAEHIIDSMYNPILVGLENGKSSQEVSIDFTDRVLICRSLLQDIDSPILDDSKTRDEFITAWEHLHNDKYNLVCFKLYDKINEENAQNMNQ